MRWVHALMSSFLTISGSRLALFRFWMFENAVHIGVPMSSRGFCSSINLSAFSLCSFRLKSHGFPCSSFPVRSSDTPVMTPSRGCLRAISATLGAE